MKTLNDLKLVENVKETRCDESLNELIQRHSPLFFRICHNYKSRLEKRGIIVNDILSDASYVIYRAALTFKTDRNTKFSSWVGLFSRYYCSTLMDNNKETFSLDCPEMENKIPENVVEPKNYTLDYILEILSQFKDKRVQSIFEMRYFYPGKSKTWKQIGDALNTSDQTIINLHRKSLKFLKSKIKSENLLDTI